MVVKDGNISVMEGYVLDHNYREESEELYYLNESGEDRMLYCINNKGVVISMDAKVNSYYITDTERMYYLEFDGRQKNLVQMMKTPESADGGGYKLNAIEENVDAIVGEYTVK